MHFLDRRNLRRHDSFVGKKNRSKRGELPPYAYSEQFRMKGVEELPMKLSS